MRLVFETISRAIIWEDDQWFFATLPLVLNSPQQSPYQPNDPRYEELQQKVLTAKSQRATLYKAEIDDLMAYARKHCAVATVKEAASLLRLDDETIYRMVDRGDLDRVPGIRHVRIPLNQLIALTQGRLKDGSKPENT